jgi:amino acid transporter
MIWSLVICTVLYILTAAVLTGVVHWKALEGNDPLAEAFEEDRHARRVDRDGVRRRDLAMAAVLLVFQLEDRRASST